ncbi:putative competence protein F [Magnetofaba australis IT-1]|uniref:Putative competence protein F n=1 Tax=Magnetofaba australis IT-1 TaxID=1434232 RepID=A0A1Y2K2B9_9PROT|nr:putative competence protein F [Magnetofaba australis IT-1]
MCGACHDQVDIQDATWRAFPYEEPIRTLATGLKYHDRTRWAHLLGAWAATRLEAPVRAFAPDCITPMPLHWRRLLFKRGYNQSALLARVLAKRLGVPLDTRGLRRARATPPQTGLSRRARLRNVRGAFAVRDDRFMGRRVLLIDDVMTTGATTFEAARVLKRAGAAQVAVACMARTQK